MNFLPDNYEPPRGASSYITPRDLPEGDTKFRILSQPILGWEDWQDKKPLRYRFDNKPAKPVDASRPIKHFWSMIVWNYAAEQIQIFTVTQATIQRPLQALCKDEDWGAPYFYDIKINKKGEGKDSEYQLNPVPHKPTAEHIVRAFNDRPIDLEALYDKADPFANTGVKTVGIFTKEQMAQVSDDGMGICDKVFTATLYAKLKTCTPEYQAVIKSACMKYGFKEDLSNLPKGEIADKMAAAIEKNCTQETLHAMGE